MAATDFETAVSQSITASNQLHDVINGTTTETVTTDSGEIPSLRKSLTDNFFFLDPIDWVDGDSSTKFNQLYKFTDGLLWYAPTAKIANPIPLGASPTGDSNWLISPFSISAPVVPRAQDRQYGDGVNTTFDTPTTVYVDPASIIARVDGLYQSSVEDYTVNPDGKLVFISGAPPQRSAIDITLYTPVISAAPTTGSNPNLIPNFDFSIAGSVANAPDATPRSYSADDELFSGFKAVGALSGVTYANGKINGTGQLYVDVYKTGKQKLSTAPYVASIAGSAGTPIEAGASHADEGDYWRVTFDMNNTFSVKLEQGISATMHKASMLEVASNSIDASIQDGSTDSEKMRNAIAIANAMNVDVYHPKRDKPLVFDEVFEVTAPVTVDLCDNELTYTDTASAVKYSAIFEFKGSLDSSVQANVSEDFEKGTTRIKLDTNPFAVGDYVAAMYDTSVTSGYDIMEKVIFMARVSSIDGDFVTVDYDAKFDLYVDGSNYKRPLTGNMKLVKASPIIGGKLKRAKFKNPTGGCRIALCSYLLAYNGRLDKCSVEDIESHLAYFAASRNTFAFDCENSNPRVTTAGQGYTVQAFGSKNVGMVRCMARKPRHHWDSSFFTVDAVMRNCESYNAQGNYDYGAHDQYVSGLLLDFCQAHGDVQTGSSETGVLWGNDSPTWGGVADRLEIRGGSYTGRASKIHAFPINNKECAADFVSLEHEVENPLINFQIKTHSNGNVTFVSPKIKGLKFGVGDKGYTKSITVHGGSIELDSQGFAGVGTATIEFYGTSVTGVPTSGFRAMKVFGGSLDVGTQANIVVDVLQLSNTVFIGSMTWVGNSSDKAKLTLNNVRTTSPRSYIRLRNHADIKGVTYSGTSNFPTLYLDRDELDSKYVTISGLEQYDISGEVGVKGVLILSQCQKLRTVSSYDLSQTDRNILFSSLVANDFTGNNSPSPKCAFTDCVKKA